MPVVFARNMRGIPHFNRRMPNHHTNGRILIGFESPFNARVDTMANDLGIWNMSESVRMTGHCFHPNPCTVQAHLSRHQRP